MQINTSSSTGLQPTLAARLAASARPANPTGIDNNAPAGTRPQVTADPARRPVMADRPAERRETRPSERPADQAAIKRLDHVANQAAMQMRKKAAAQGAPNANPSSLTTGAQPTTPPGDAEPAPKPLTPDTGSKVNTGPTLTTDANAEPVPPVPDKDTVAKVIDKLSDDGPITGKRIREALDTLGIKPTLNDGTPMDDKAIDDILSNTDSPAPPDGNYELDIAGLTAAWGESDSPYDLDGDGTVGSGDLMMLLANGGTMMGEAPKNLTMKGLLADYGKANSPYDLNGDGTVDTSDLLEFMSREGASDNV